MAFARYNACYHQIALLIGEQSSILSVELFYRVSKFLLSIKMFK